MDRRTYPAADSADSAAEAAEEVAPTTAPETEEAASTSSVVVVAESEPVSSEEAAEEVAVAGGASPAAVLGVWTAAWAHTPSAAETAPSTSSGFYQLWNHSSRGYSLHRWIVDSQSRYLQQNLIFDKWQAFREKSRLTTCTKAGPIASTTSSLNISSFGNELIVKAYIEAREPVETSSSTSTLSSFKRARSL